MSTVVASKRLKQQLRKIIQAGRRDLDKFETVVNILQRGSALPPKYLDHQLKGKLQDFRECHISSDWLLIYRKYEDLLILELAATGSHAKLLE